jgi:DNA-binding response OmpR family regulator
LDSDRVPPHVLVVEDNELVAGAMRILFESSDHRVSTTGTIVETLRLVQRDPAALVLLDLTLPDGDGLTLVPQLLASGCKTVVALTGYDDPETHQRCLSAGCAEVLVKPVPARELLRRAAAWLDG